MSEEENDYATQIREKASITPSRVRASIVGFAIGSVMLLMLTIVALAAVFQSNLGRRRCTKRCWRRRANS